MVPSPRWGEGQGEGQPADGGDGDVWTTKDTKGHEKCERPFVLFAAFRVCRDPNCPPLICCPRSSGCIIQVMDRACTGYPVSAHKRITRNYVRHRIR